jgi:glycosyltransferase involved in cell wall biosynthesis
MITLIGDIGIFNNNPLLIGIKSLFDQHSQIETQILTPTVIYDRNSIAEANHFRQVSVWSIFDCFTGRMVVPERHFRPEDYQPPQDYQPEIAPVVKKFFREDKARIELEVKHFGNLSAANFYDSDGKLARKALYDDGGYLSSLEIPSNENVQDKQLILYSPEGNIVFELEIHYYRISKVHYLPEDLLFERLEDFYSWAFLSLFASKKSSDKIFVAQNNFRQALLYSAFDPEGVYLIADTLISGAEDRDIFADHYEKVVFNVKSDRDALAKKFEGKIKAPLVWNNFSAPEKLCRDFSSEPQIYFYIGQESEEVRFDLLLKVFDDLLRSNPELKLILHFAFPYDPPKILDQMDENFRERLTILTRPFPHRMREEISKTDLYVSLSKPEAIPPLSLNDAISAQIPILAVLGQPALSTFVNEDNGRRVGYAQLENVTKRALELPKDYFELADDLSAVRQYFSPESTLARWLDIFAENGNR